MSTDPDSLARYLASIAEKKRADSEARAVVDRRRAAQLAAGMGALSAPLPPPSQPMIPTAFQDVIRRIYGERLPYEYLLTAMASALGVQRRAVQRWISGKQPIPPDVEADAQALLAIAERRRQ